MEPAAPALGIFDSGVGGLSVVREMLIQYPAQPFIYLADQFHAPYGQRPLDEIRELSAAITRFLLARGAQVIVVACNTASAAALHWLREQYPTIPFVGMEPAIKPAAERTRSGKVGVIATAATFQGQLFASLLDRYATGVEVLTQACADLVPLIEAGQTDTAAMEQAVRRYLTPLLDAGIDQLVLGCTHYPFVSPVLRRVAGDSVSIIDPAPAVARQAGRVLEAHGWRAGGSEAGQRTYYTTGDGGRFRLALQQLIGVCAAVEAAGWSEQGELSLWLPQGVE